MKPFSRRSRIGSGAIVGAASISTIARGAAPSFGNPDLPPQGAVNANPQSLTDPGPQNPNLANNLPSFINPPATDVGSLPMFWNSFNIAARRQQNGGWARQVTQAEMTDDGPPHSEASFLACTFWYASNLALQGRLAEAETVFARVLSVAGRALGNFPQALTHVSLIGTAFNLTGRGPSPVRRGRL